MADLVIFLIHQFTEHIIVLYSYCPYIPNYWPGHNNSTWWNFSKNCNKYTDPNKIVKTAICFQINIKA